MADLDIRPGPAAAQAFRLGTVAAAVLGLVGIGLLYWMGALAPIAAGYLLVFLYPVYLVVAAAVLSQWLGYGKDATALRPVSRSERSK